MNNEKIAKPGESAKGEKLSFLDRCKFLEVISPKKSKSASLA
jgi:hypothetical protein